MTFLPIVERELRVASRRRGTQWMRFFVALTVLVIWLVLIVSAQSSMPPAQLGHQLFMALSILAFGFCLLAGVFLTADCLSSEKREGTLGLLFLTDLKGYDVVLGKLAATSLHAFYGLLATLPVMALPLLMGGVSAGEFGRVSLMLVATLFLSLAVGMAVSAISRETRHAMAGAFCVIALLAGVFPALWWFQKITLRAHLLNYTLLLASPPFGYMKAFDSAYGTASGRLGYWASLATFVGLGLGLLALACRLLPRVWQTPRAPASLRIFPGGASERSFPPALSRKPLGEGNPFAWLASRERKPRVVVNWIVGLVTLIWFGFLLGCFQPGSKHTAFSVCMFTTYGLHVILKCLVAVEASRQFSEDRRSGALELLLVTPLPAESIVVGQWSALWRHFRWPLMATLVVNVGMIWLILGPDPVDMGENGRRLFTWIFLGGILELCLDFRALVCVGMWMGARGRKHHRAVLATLGRVMLGPWLGIFLFIFLGMAGVFRGSGAEDSVISIWFFAGILYSLVVGQLARSRLVRNFRNIATGAEQEQKQPALALDAKP